jgi:small subunit ribosomal protein S8
MSLSDPIADMLTRIRNAGNAKHASCKVSGSKLKKSILDILKAEGFITDYSPVAEAKYPEFQIQLKYDQGKKSVIREIRRVSTPGKRVYVPATDVKPYKSNLGIVILSTSKGVMTNKKAMKLNIGGEVICSVA